MMVLNYLILKEAFLYFLLFRQLKGLPLSIIRCMVVLQILELKIEYLDT